MAVLPRLKLADLPIAPAVDSADDEARDLIARLAAEGEPALRELAGLDDAVPLLVERDELEKAYLRLGGDERAVLARAARRVELFAREQQGAWHALDAPVTGGRAGQRLVPLTRVACVVRDQRLGEIIQGVSIARVAGVEQVLVATATPTLPMLAAAAAAHADALLVVGGAPAAAALGLGLVGRPCDRVVGAGDALTRAVLRRLPGGLPLGDARVLLLADRSARASELARELLLLVEAGSGPCLLATDEAMLVDEVEGALIRELGDDHPELVAELARGGCVVMDRLDDAEELTRRWTPGLLLTRGEQAEQWAGELQPVAHAELGRLPVVPGPGHWLPGVAGAHWRSGLSVAHFLRVQTWSRVEDDPEGRELVADARVLAMLEGRSLSQRLLEDGVGGPLAPSPEPRLQPQPERARTRAATQLAD